MRRRLLHGDELLEVLLQHVRRRHGVARLLELAALQRRAVGEREQRDADAEHEEDDRQQYGARRAREREQRQADAGRPAPAGPLDRAQQRRQESRGHDREHEEHKTGKQEQHDAGAAARCERRRVGLPAREREQDRGERAESRDVCGVEGDAAERDPLHAQRDEHDERGDRGERHRDPERAPREERVLDDEAARRAEVAREQGAGPAPGDPAGDAGDDRDRGHLGSGHEQDLPPPRAEPREPASRRVVVAAQPRRREDREAEEEDGRIPAEDEQALARDAARRADAGDGVERRLHREDVALLLQLRLRAVDARAETREIPVVDRPRGERHDPSVRTRDQGGIRERRAREPGDAVGEQDGRPVRPGGGEVGRERRAGRADPAPPASRRSARARSRAACRRAATARCGGRASGTAHPRRRG